MYPGDGSTLWVLATVSIIWLFVLSFFVWKSNLFLKRLFPERQEDFKGELEEVLRVSERLESFRKKNLDNIQKIYLKRYNPYHDTGGDQSFSLVLLDGKLNGTILTSLHSRSGTRIYAKVIKKGESELDLSKEEKEVLKKAIQNV